jgi:predicted HD phosphohydrolase
VFTRMDEGTEAEWQSIREAVLVGQRRVADRILPMLQSLEHSVDGFPVDQLTHALQTATRAERAGAPEDVVVMALCHDLGKFVSTANHAAMSAEILRPYVRDDLYRTVLHHQVFQGDHYNDKLGFPTGGRVQFAAEPWYDLCATFTDEWDQTSFDPGYDTLSIEHFEPAVRRVFEEPRITV